MDNTHRIAALTCSPTFASLFAAGGTRPLNPKSWPGLVTDPVDQTSSGSPALTHLVPPAPFPFQGGQQRVAAASTLVQERVLLTRRPMEADSKKTAASTY